MTIYEGLHKADLLEAGLKYFQVRCGACGDTHIEVEPQRDHPHLPFGSVCNCCGTQIWANGRYGPLKKAWADYQGNDKRTAQKSSEAFGEWNQKRLDEFFALLPNCPACKKHDYKPFNVMEPIPCPHCGVVGNVADVTDVTGKYYGERVWWFGPFCTD